MKLFSSILVSSTPTRRQRISKYDLFRENSCFLAPIGLYCFNYFMQLPYCRAIHRWKELFKNGILFVNIMCSYSVKLIFKTLSTFRESPLPAVAYREDKNG